MYDEAWDRSRALQWHDLNLDFHYALLELAQNRWLTDAVRRARKSPIVFDSHSRPHDHGKIVLLYQRKNSQQALDEHLRIVDALARRETTRAESLMREHILTNRDVMVNAFAGAATDSSE
ncbi:FCD domain-containing protein [Variovorax sp. LT1R20]|uniref:FCD domain-containing protein n=1 Tax=Variovorax sp. LT1R20 TaxID=3443729 RepID=UPI003F46EFB7